MLEAVQNQDIWGGPLSIAIYTWRSFGGVLPGDDDEIEWLKSWVEETLKSPAGEPIGGQVAFKGRRFHYRLDAIWVPTAYPRWRKPVPAHWDYFWTAEEAAEHLEYCWCEEYAHLFEEEPKNPEPSAPQLVLAPAIAEPVKTEKPALWDESRMAEALGLTEASFVERLESGYWAYKYSQRIETWDESKRPLKVVKYRYTFSEAVRMANIKNKEKRKKIVMEEGE